jgi:hypothetical protein
MWVEILIIKTYLSTKSKYKMKYPVLACSHSFRKNNYFPVFLLFLKSCSEEEKSWSDTNECKKKKICTKISTQLMIVSIRLLRKLVRTESWKLKLSSLENKIICSWKKHLQSRSFRLKNIEIKGELTKFIFENEFINDLYRKGMTFIR